MRQTVNAGLAASPSAFVDQKGETSTKQSRSGESGNMPFLEGENRKGVKARDRPYPLSPVTMNGIWVWKHAYGVWGFDEDGVAERCEWRNIHDNDGNDDENDNVGGDYLRTAGEAQVQVLVLIVNVKRKITCFCVRRR